jgi:hypothetical protein
MVILKGSASCGSDEASHPDVRKAAPHYARVTDWLWRMDLLGGPSSEISDVRREQYGVGGI